MVGPMSIMEIFCGIIEFLQCHRSIIPKRLKKKKIVLGFYNAL